MRFVPLIMKRFWNLGVPKRYRISEEIFSKEEMDEELNELFSLSASTNGILALITIFIFFLFIGEILRLLLGKAKSFAFIPSEMYLVIFITIYIKCWMLVLIQRYPVDLGRRFLWEVYGIGGALILWKYYRWFDDDVLGVVMISLDVVLRIVLFFKTWVKRDHYAQREREYYLKAFAKKAEDKEIKDAQYMLKKLYVLEKIWLFAKILISCGLYFHWLNYRNRQWYYVYFVLAILILINCVSQRNLLFNIKSDCYGLFGNYLNTPLVALGIALYLYYVTYLPIVVFVPYVVFRFYIWKLVRPHYEGLKYIEAMYYLQKE